MSSGGGLQRNPKIHPIKSMYDLPVDLQAKGVISLVDPTHGASQAVSIVAGLA